MRNLLYVAVALAAGCGDDGGVDLSSYDARCVTACTDTPPQIEGAGDVCTSASRVTCLDACEARITDVSSVCATCLTEETCFDPGGCDSISPNFCDQTSCTITGRNGSCTYQQGNQAMQEACERQVNPRREVTCTAEFPSVQSCASVCQM